MLQRGCWSEKSFSGGAAEESDWQLRLIDSAADHFEVLYQGVVQGRVTWNITGAHNRMNALAAIAAARHVGVAPATAIEALSQFVTVKRRMEVRGEVNGVRVIDDFAHHPTAIQTTQRVYAAVLVLAAFWRCWSHAQIP